MTTALFNLIKFALVAACSVGPEDGSPPDDAPDGVKPPPVFKEENQHFCCTSVSVGTSGKGEGQGCTTIGAQNIDACQNVLACPNGFIKVNNDVTCL